MVVVVRSSQGRKARLAFDDFAPTGSGGVGAATLRGDVAGNVQASG